MTHDYIISSVGELVDELVRKEPTCSVHIVHDEVGDWHVSYDNGIEGSERVIGYGSNLIDALKNAREKVKVPA